MTIDVERIRRALRALEDSTEPDVYDLQAVPRWRVQRREDRFHNVEWFVTTPRAPRPSDRLRHIVGPSEFNTTSLGGLLEFLRNSWRADALMAISRAAIGEPLNGASVEHVIATATVDVENERWAPDASGTWHRMGTDVGTTGAGQDAPPTGTTVCERCLVAGIAARHDDRSK